MFYLGRLSEERLGTTDARIQRIVRRAIAQSSVDFSVVEGIRSETRQRELVQAGASRKLDSYHLTGHAVDICPYIAGALVWKLAPMLQVTIAMRLAALFFTEAVTWGGVWDRRLDELDPRDLEFEIDAYRARYAAAHGPRARPLMDPWHFQVER